jgi:hypothetical protein
VTASRLYKAVKAAASLDKHTSAKQRRENVDKEEEKKEVKENGIGKR